MLSWRRSTKNTKVELYSEAIYCESWFWILRSIYRQRSSASQMTAANVIDVTSILPGCAGQATDAVPAYIHVRMEKHGAQIWRLENILSSTLLIRRHASVIPMIGKGAQIRRLDKILHETKKKIHRGMSRRKFQTAWRQNTSPLRTTDAHFLVFPHTWQMRKTFLPKRVTMAQDHDEFGCFQSAFLTKSSCHHMFHRNILGLPDHPLAFPATLVKEPCNTCADPRSGSLIGRMAEQGLLSGLSLRTWSCSPASTHRLISLLGRTASPPKFLPLLHLTSRKRLKQDSCLYHCSRRSEKYVQIPSVSVFRGKQQQAEASIIKCDKSSAKLRWWKLREGATRWWYSSEVERSLLRRKRDRDLESVSLSQHDREKILLFEWKNLHGYLEQEAARALQVECTAQRRLSEAEVEMDKKKVGLGNFLILLSAKSIH